MVTTIDNNHNFALFLSDQLDVIVSYWDSNLICNYANQAFSKWFGKSVKSIVGHLTMQELLGPHFAKNEVYLKGTLDGRKHQFETSVTINPNQVRCTLFKCHPHIQDNIVCGFYVHTTDISYIKNLERAADTSRSIINAISDGVISKTTDGTILTWSKGAEKILGYRAQDMIGKNISTIIPKDLCHEEAFVLSSVLSGHNLQEHETVRLKKDGTRVNVAITLSVIKNKSGEILGIAKVIRDITLQKKAETELHQSNERNRIFVQQSPNALAMFDREMKYIAASQRWLTDYKLQGRDIIGKSHYEIFPEITDSWKKIHKECLAGAVNQCDEALFERADGTRQWITWDVRPWYLSENNIGGLLIYAADITHMKERDAEKVRIQHILEKSNQVARIATWEVDALTGKASWSQTATEIFEVPHDHIPTKDGIWAFYKKGENFDKLLAAIKDSTEKGIPYDLEAEIITAKNNSRWIRVIGEAEFRDKICIRRFGIFQDITKNKESEVALHKVNDELSAILNASHVSIIGTNVSGVITHFSQGSENLLGYKAKEMVGINTPELIHVKDEVVARGDELSTLFGRDIRGFDAFVEMARHGKFDSREWTYVRKDGSRFPVQLVVTAIKNKDGVITGFLGVATDISDLKNAEKETKALLEISTEQNERLKNFAHIVSHNLRSHSGNISMLLMLYMESNPDLANNEYVSLLNKASDNLKETIADLNEVALINLSTAGKLVPVNLFQKIESAQYNVFQLAREAGVTIRNEVGKEVSVLGLAAYIDSILLNFITNGIKYRSDSPDAYVKLTSLVADDYVILKIEDNGLGIDLNKYGKQLFGMYKTFHNKEDARGIGLFITKNQVESIGGKIEVESEPGIGTTFKIYFRY